MGRIAHGIIDDTSQCDAAAKVWVDNAVGSFNQGNSLKSCVFPTIQFIQIGARRTTTQKAYQKRCNELEKIRQRGRPLFPPYDKRLYRWKEM